MTEHRMRRLGPVLLLLAAVAGFVAGCGESAGGPVERGPQLAAAGPAGAPAGAPAAGPAAAEPVTQGMAPGQQLVFDLSKVGYDRGDPNAPVFVVEFSDFGCPYCGVFARETFPALHEEFVVTGKVRWKYVPFALGMFPNGEEAARAAECAAEQGAPAFWEMHDRLYLRQREWKSSADPTDLFARYAADLKLDRPRFRSCFDEDRPRDRFRMSNMSAAQLGVRATPTFFINGTRVEGAVPLDNFRFLLRRLTGG